MKLSVLNELFKAEYPDGKVEHSRKSGCLAVTFKPGGRVYHYRATVVGLAERFNLIPEFDFCAESARIIRELRAGGEAIGPLGIFDTVREFCAPEEVGYLRSDSAGADRYGRPLIRVWVSDEWDPWLRKPTKNGERSHENCIFD